MAGVSAAADPSADDESTSLSDAAANFRDGSREQRRVVALQVADMLAHRLYADCVRIDRVGGLAPQGDTDEHLLAVDRLGSGDLRKPLAWPLADHLNLDELLVVIDLSFDALCRDHAH